MAKSSVTVEIADLPDPVTVSNGDMVRAKSLEADPIAIQWNSRKYIIEPDKATVIPFEALCLWFGDPRATETVSQVKDGQETIMIPDRPSEVRRLQLKWSPPKGDGFAAEGVIENYPSVEFYTLDEDRIWTVVDDIEGTQVVYSNVTKAEQADQSNLLRKMAEEIAELKAAAGLTSPVALDDLDDDEDDDQSTGDIPEDTTGTGSSTKGPAAVKK